MGDGAPTEWITVALPPPVVRVGFSEEGDCKWDESGEPGPESGAGKRVCKAFGDGRPWGGGRGWGARVLARPWMGEPPPASSDHAHFLRGPSATLGVPAPPGLFHNLCSLSRLL